MRWTTHVIAITAGLLMVSAAGFGQQQGQQGNRNSGPQTTRVAAEHDSLTNADFSTSMDPNGTALFTVKAGDFLLEKALDSAGNSTLRLTQGKDEVTIVLNQAGYLVSRGKRTVRFDPRSPTQAEARDAVRAVLLGSPAVRSLRRLSVILENRDERADESPMMLNALVDGAVVQMLDGDPGAMPRIAKRMVRKQLAKLKVVRLPGETFKDCIGLYETSLLSAWDQYMQCMEWARNVHWWFEDWAEGFCHTEWLLRGQQYLWQFTSCLALPF